MSNSSDTPRERNDSDLRDNLPTPSHSGSSGGDLATDIGSRDEEKSARGDAAGTARVAKADKVQPDTSTRSDHDGAA